MSKVSDMIKMYSQSNSTSTTANKTAPVARKWPSVATQGGSGANKPPVLTPKPTPGAARPSLAPKPARQRDESKPAWVKNGRDEPKKATTAPWLKPKPSEKEETQNVPEWQRERNIPKGETVTKHGGWGQNGTQEAKTMTEKEKVTKPAWAKNTNETTSSWAKPKFNDSKAPSSYNVQQNTKQHLSKDTGDSNSTTMPWSQRNKPKQETGDISTRPPLWNASKPGINDSTTPGLQTSITKATPQSTTKKASFGGGISTNSTQEKNSSLTSPEKRMNSFLHTKRSEEAFSESHQTVASANSASNKPPKVSGIPPRMKIPRERYQEPPPTKTAKPSNVVLPGKGKKKFSLPSLPTNFLSRSTPTTRDPPAGKDISTPTLPGARGLPPVGNRKLPPPPTPVGARDLPSLNLPPELPSRPVGHGPPSLPSRTLPPPSPNKKSTPLPPPPVADGTYDDLEGQPSSRPMIPPPPLLKKESSGLIPTWDDEIPDAIYDDTPDDVIARPSVPAGFPTPGNPVLIPEESEDMYEDVEEYMRLKKLSQQRQHAEENESANGNDGIRKDKRKKDLEKKEKEMRRKFKLPLEGEINAEGRGVVTETSKAGWARGGLSVTAGEEIEVVRMTDNPKGKWLIRNFQGEYGFVDSDKVQIDIQQLRSTFGVGGKGVGSGAVIQPNPMSIEDDGEAIYDQTADEDIYEEV